MLEEQADENDHEACRVGHTEAGKQSEDGEEAPHEHMGEEGGLEGVAGAPADDERVEVMGSVEFVVLEGIDDIEPDEPEDDGGGEDEGEDGALLWGPESEVGAVDGEPGADGCEGEGDTEVEVGEVGEAFSEGVEADGDEGDGGEGEADGVEEVGGGDEAEGAEGPESPGGGEGDLAGGEVSGGGAGVFGVEVSIDDAIKDHGAGAGADHGGEDEQEGTGAWPAAVIACGDDHGGDGEWEGEDGVGELDEVCPAAEEGDHPSGSSCHRVVSLWGISR